MQRVEIFTERIHDDKQSLGFLDQSCQQPATYITIQRNRILEGGYEQLSSLSVRALKGVVRVKFVNEQVQYVHWYLHKTLDKTFCRYYYTV